MFSHKYAKKQSPATEILASSGTASEIPVRKHHNKE
jgi:hypothetical protein